MAGGEALKDAALVVEFGHDDPPSHLQGECRVEGVPVLLEAGEAVVILGGQKTTKVFAGPGEYLNGDFALKDGGERRRGEVDALADDEAFEVAEGDFPEQFLVLVRVLASVDFETVSLEVDPQIRLVQTGGRHVFYGLADAALSFAGCRAGARQLRMVQPSARSGRGRVLSTGTG